MEDTIALDQETILSLGNKDVNVLDRMMKKKSQMKNLMYVDMRREGEQGHETVLKLNKLGGATGIGQNHAMIHKNRPHEAMWRPTALIRPLLLQKQRKQSRLPAQIDLLFHLLRCLQQQSRAHKLTCQQHYDLRYQKRLYVLHGARL